MKKVFEVEHEGKNMEKSPAEDLAWISSVDVVFLKKEIKSLSFDVS